MDEMERLRSELQSANDQVGQLRERLEEAHRQLDSYAQRLALSDQERQILNGQGDGCVRLAELRPIVRRVFGEAA